MKIQNPNPFGIGKQITVRLLTLEKLRGWAGFYDIKIPRTLFDSGNLVQVHPDCLLETEHLLVI